MTQNRLTQEQKEEIQRLYDNGNGMHPLEIAKKTGVNYDTVRSYTHKAPRARSMTNPETGRKFKSLNELHIYQTEQRINPETGKPF